MSSYKERSAFNVDERSHNRANRAFVDGGKNSKTIYFGPEPEKFHGDTSIKKTKWDWQ